MSSKIRSGNLTPGKPQIGDQMMTSAASIPPDWINWIAENHALGVAEAEIIDILVVNGFDRRIAIQQLALATGKRDSQSAEVVAQKLRKLESLMSIYSDLWSQSHGAAGID